MRHTFVLPASLLLIAGTVQADDNASDQLDTIVVTGRAQSLYSVDQSSVSTRIDADLKDVPASVQVINAELISDQGARDVRDLYRSISGVNVFSYSGITFRGFRQDEVLYDGLRGDPYAGFAVPRLFGVDRVEVLKGPSGALYGAGDPGGLINYVSSQAAMESEARAQLIAGNYDLNGINFEAQGALGGSDFGYRIAGLKETEEPFREHTTNDNDQGDLGFTWQPSDSTRAYLKYSYVDQSLGANRLRGVPINEQGEFLVDTSWNHNEPTDFLTLTADILYGRFQHAFNGSVNLDFAIRHYDNQEKQNYHEPRGLFDSDGDGEGDMMDRQFRDQIRNSTGLSSYLNLVTLFETGSIKHQFLFGAEYFEQDSDFKAKRGSPQSDDGDGVVPPLGLYDPQYGQTSRAQYGLDGIDWQSDSKSYLKQSGIYLQDLITLNPQWDLLMSVRYNQFDSGAEGDPSDSDNAFTYRLGGVYHFSDNINFYSSVSQGFVPQSASSQEPDKGGPFDPEESNQIEIGAKITLWDGRGQLNIAAYDIERTNILQADPNPNPPAGQEDRLVALGKVGSRGGELDLSLDILPQWTMTLNYGYNDAHVMEVNENDGITNATGGKFANAPLHQMGLWTRYDFLNINSALSFGAEYKSDQISIDGRPVKAYSIFDAGWRTDLDVWKFQINIKNLFDKEYAESGFIFRTGHFPGEPRRVELALSREF